MGDAVVDGRLLLCGEPIKANHLRKVSVQHHF